MQLRSPQKEESFFSPRSRSVSNRMVLRERELCSNSILPLLVVCGIRWNDDFINLLISVIAYPPPSWPPFYKTVESSRAWISSVGYKILLFFFFFFSSKARWLNIVDQSWRELTGIINYPIRIEFLKWIKRAAARVGRDGWRQLAWTVQRRLLPRNFPEERRKIHNKFSNSR